MRTYILAINFISEHFFKFYKLDSSIVNEWLSRINFTETHKLLKMTNQFLSLFFISRIHLSEIGELLQVLVDGVHRGVDVVGLSLEVDRHLKENWYTIIMVRLWVCKSIS